MYVNFKTTMLLIVLMVALCYNPLQMATSFVIDHAEGLPDDFVAGVPLTEEEFNTSVAKLQKGSCDSKFITTAICENNENEIACPSKISIVMARYGRYSKDTCFGQNDQLKCDKDVFEIISMLCNDKTNCNLKVTNELMGGDPCYGIYKYLEVQYYCY